MSSGLLCVRRRRLIEVGAEIRGAKNAARDWRFRRGLLLVLEDEAGRLGYGEASPLPGVSGEELSSCRFLLEDLQLPTLYGLEEVSAFVAKVPRKLPSARFAVETALYDLFAQRLGVSVASLLGPKRSRTALCQLLSDGDTPSSPVVKVKAGALPFEEELVRLRALRERLGPQVRLRIDFNRTLPAFGLLQRLERLAEVSPELVEEPAPPEALLSLPRAPVPIGLDESLVDRSGCVADLVQLGLVRALVLKPMLLGGAAVCMRLAERAESVGLAVTVTHAFDGPVAHAMASAIALALPGEVLSPGLWPHPVLEAWGERRLPHLEQGAVVVPSVQGLGVGGAV